MPKKESKYYAVIGRIPFDDEDSMLVTHTTSEKKAIAAFVKFLYSESDESKKEVTKSYGGSHIITYVLCSDTPIACITMPY